MAVKAAGELFVTMAKEGSTISDLMDSSAIAVSGNNACGPVSARVSKPLLSPVTK
jgi:hypothetical protein